MTWFRLHDSEPGSGMVELAPRDAERWNGKGWGIFATVQKFNGPRRKENLERIRAWAIDLDEGTKAEQRERIQRSPLEPSSIVETKNGYHVYWYAIDGKAEHYRGLLDRLVAFFGADKNARDLARVLRVPGFLHLKDPAAPFLVKHVHGPNQARAYTERQMFAYFPATEDESRERHREQRAPASSSGSLWEAIYELDARETLARLSGHWSVGGEQYGFRDLISGKTNLTVDGKSCSAFVDESGHIGSSRGGGPTPAQWLRYFGHQWKTVLDVLCEVHPHLTDLRGGK